MNAVKNYLIGERWEVQDLLDWAEKFSTMPIEEHHITGTQSYMMQGIGLNVIQASQELWAFLNARPKVDKAPRLNGVVVWCRVVCPMAPKLVARRVDLLTDLHNPPRAKKLSELTDAIESWEKLRDRHYQMGGQTVKGDEQCVISLKMLPPDTPSTMVMALEVYRLWRIEGEAGETDRLVH